MMRRLFNIIVAAIMFVGFISGCTKTATTCPPEPNCTYRIERIVNYDITDYEVTYDGKLIDNLSHGLITVETNEYYYNCICIICRAVFDGKSYSLNTGYHSGVGSGYSARFWEYNDDGTFFVDGHKEYWDMGVSVDARFEEIMDAPSSSELRPDFDCDIEIKSEIEGRELVIRITGIQA